MHRPNFLVGLSCICTGVITCHPSLHSSADSLQTQGLYRFMSPGLQGVRVLFEFCTIWDKCAFFLCDMKGQCRLIAPLFWRIWRAHGSTALGMLSDPLGWFPGSPEGCSSLCEADWARQLSGRKNPAVLPWKKTHGLELLAKVKGLKVKMLLEHSPRLIDPCHPGILSARPLLARPFAPGPPPSRPLAP